MKLLKIFKNLCAPAQIYLALSILTTLTMCFQNIGNSNIYACGLLKTRTPIHNMVYIALQFIYVIIWTYLLNMLCKKGFKTMSWILLLIPYIIMFILIGLIFIILKTN